MTRCIACLAVVIATLGSVPAIAQVLDFHGDDAEMNEAIDNARETLPEFLKRAASMPIDTWFLKAALPTHQDDITDEHIWLGQCERIDTVTFSCAISNEPVHLLMHAGQRVEFGMELVTDWMFYDETGLIHGAYSTRVMVTRLPDDQAEPIAAQLAPLD